MLGYLPKVQQLLGESSNENHFIYATSGFNAVTNSFMIELLSKAKTHLQTEDFKALVAKGYFARNGKHSDADVHAYLDAHALMCEEGKAAATTRRLLRALWLTFGEGAEHNPKNNSNSLPRYCFMEWFTEQIQESLEYFQVCAKLLLAIEPHRRVSYAINRSFSMNVCYVRSV